MIKDNIFYMYWSRSHCWV